MITQKQLGRKIRKLREEFNYSQEEFSKALKLSRPAVSNIESGQRSVDAIEIARIAKIFRVEAGLLLQSDALKRKIKAKIPKNNAGIKLVEKKLKNLILYVLEKCGGKPNIGETVLYKLFYFIDFDNYELYGRPITGMRYIKLQFGPVPRLADYRPVVEKMTANEELKIISQKYHNRIQKRYIALVEADPSVFTADELEIINKTIARLSDMGASQIENYVHQDIPWKGAEDKQEISYESVYYRASPYTRRDYEEAIQDASGKDILDKLGEISKREHDYYINLK